MGVLKAGYFVLCYVVLSTLGLYWWHLETHGLGSLNFVVLGLQFFLPLNALICWWELALGWHISQVQQEYRALKERYKGNHLAAVKDLFLCEATSCSEILSLKFWTKIWSTYSLYDPSYQNQESFGFFIDVGNGWSTLLPTVLFSLAISGDVAPTLLTPRVIGLMGLMKFYQEWYGTVVYFLSFVFNRRYQGLHWGEVAGFVGISNGLWFFFPLLGMYASIRLVIDEDYSVFGR